jgi:hypothetical protein
MRQSADEGKGEKEAAFYVASYQGRAMRPRSADLLPQALKMPKFPFDDSAPRAASPYRGKAARLQESRDKI